MVGSWDAGNATEGTMVGSGAQGKRRERWLVQKREGETRREQL